MKKAFSLIELIVVIGIIATLMTVAVPQIAKSRESARAAQCMANMRTLAQGCYNAAMEKDYHPVYPFAGSTEYAYLKRINGKEETVYGEHKGWLSWQCGDYYANDPKAHKANSSVGWGASEEQVEFAITNGAIWRSVGRNRSCYLCPAARRIRPSAGWSYAMNGFFRYDYSEGSETTSTAESGVWMNTLECPDRILMFAELEIPESGGGSGYEADGILEYDDGTSKHQESIGFCHKINGRDCAHVAFADCHVERLVKPTKGDVKELTKWLCEGTAIVLTEGAYRMADATADDDND